MLPPRPPAGRLQQREPIAHGGRLRVRGLAHQRGDFGQRRHGLPHVRPGDRGQVLGRAAEALQVPLVAQVVRNGVVDQGFGFSNASRNGVEPPRLRPLVGVSLGLTPAARKQAAMPVARALNVAVELEPPSLVPLVPPDRHRAMYSCTSAGSKRTAAPKRCDGIVPERARSYTARRLRPSMVATWAAVSIRPARSGAAAPPLVQLPVSPPRLRRAHRPCPRGPRR